MNLFKKLFRKKKKIDESKQFDKYQNDTNLKLQEKFALLSADERLKSIMSLGDTGQNNFFDLLKFSIQSDPDIDVRFAALKRIHLFKEHPDLISFLKLLVVGDKQPNLEPYLSMALSRVGIITQGEFQYRINNSTPVTLNTNNQSWAKFANGSSIDTTGSEGGKITEDFECIKGARVTIEKNGSIAPYSVTLGIYGLMFHTHFASTEIEAKKFMDFALKKIDEIFAHNEIIESERDTTWNNKHDSLISELTQ